MNFQDAAREYFKQQLGVTSGSYPEVATAYYLALINGTITPGGPTAIGDVTGLQSALDGKADASALAGKADTDHTHGIADVTGLQDALNTLSGRITALEEASGG